jgi:hypothetical protein
VKLGGGKRENDGGGKSKIHYKYIHNITMYPPIQLLLLTNVLKRKQPYL